MAANADTAEQQILVEKIEVASEIVRSSQATVAFQRVFYLEMLSFDRVHKEMTDFKLKVDGIQSKLSALFNELQQVENHVGASRASAISEKLDTLKDSLRDLTARALEAKAKRETLGQELNKILPEIRQATITTMTGDVKLVRPPNLTAFVSDQDFHLAEDISEEWLLLRRKLDNFLQRYVEDITSLKVEAFGATYSIESPDQSVPDCSRGIFNRLSGLIPSRKLPGASTKETEAALGDNNARSNNSKSKNKRVCSSRSESFFYRSVSPAVQEKEPTKSENKSEQNKLQSTI